jgi:hypothetical protein
MPVVKKTNVTPVTGSGYPEPHNLGSGHFQAWQISDAGGLNAFSDQHHFTRKYGASYPPYGKP